MIGGPITIVGLDPGGTTGWAKYDAIVTMTPDGEAEYYNEEWSAGQMGPGDHHKQLFDTLCLWQPHNYIIVCESFEFRREQRDNVVLVSKEYIGIVNYFEQERMVKFTEGARGPAHQEVVYQTASMGKGFWYPKKPGTQQRDKSKLEAVGRYNKGMIHANDATAHLLHHMSFTMGRRDLFEGLKK